MVTRYEIDESKMGNRVSKSNEEISFVKEQRVDGSCFLSCNHQEQEVKVYSNGSTKVEYQGQILSKSPLAKSTPTFSSSPSSRGTKKGENSKLENSSLNDTSNNITRLD